MTARFATASEPREPLASALPSESRSQCDAGLRRRVGRVSVKSRRAAPLDNGVRLLLRPPLVLRRLRSRLRPRSRLPKNRKNALRVMHLRRKSLITYDPVMCYGCSNGFADFFCVRAVVNSYELGFDSVLCLRICCYHLYGSEIAF